MIVLDIETTGTDERMHSIISIGALDFADHTNTFYGECRPWRGAQINPESLAISGLDLEAMTLEHDDLIRAFDAWQAKIPDRTIAGHNVGGFDMKFLQEAYKRAGLKFAFGYRSVDVHSVVYAKFLEKGIPFPADKYEPSLSGLHLNRILEIVGIPKREGAHNALDDAKLEAEVLSRIIYGKGLLHEYTHHPLPAIFQKHL